MTSVLDHLKGQIRKNPVVTSSVLGLTERWKSSHYALLSEIINAELLHKEVLQGDKKYELGNTISASTLKRIFENNFSETSFKDLRFLKTLDKLAIFTGYKDFNDFIRKKVEGMPVNNEVQQREEYIDYFVEIIKKSNLLEFEFVLGKTKIEDSDLEDYLFREGPFYNRIETYLDKLKKLGLTIINEPMPNYLVYNFSLKNRTEDLVVISTEEFWNYTFVDSENKKHYYHTNNKQDYFFKRENGIWKIFDNYNPNVWELTDRI